MARVYNFSAGPSMLPESVLKKAAAEMLDYEGSGQSVMEMSHRSKIYGTIIEGADITTVAAIEGGWLFDDRDAEFIYAHSGEFPVDMPLFYQTMDLAKVWKLGLRRVGGNIMVDGTLSSHSAALSAPYADRPDYRGQIFLPQDGLDEFVQQCYRQDMQLALYSIGDRAIESVLLAHERAIRSNT